MSDLFDIVDFHAHILPGADHGSSDVETSLYQLSEAKNNGVKRIIATPHFYPTAHKVDKFLLRRNNAYNSLRSNSDGTYAQIKLGAEVLICEDIEDLPGLDKLFIYGTKTLLLELPFSDFSDSYCDSVFTLVSRGVNVILAHADRYPPEHIENMINAGALIQINASSLVTILKRRSVYNWLDRELVVAVGSDIHGKDKNAYRSFSKALSKIQPYLKHIKKCSDNIFSEALSI